jgi:hypothetical protein
MITFSIACAQLRAGSGRAAAPPRAPRRDSRVGRLTPAGDAGQVQHRRTAPRRTARPLFYARHRSTCRAIRRYDVIFLLS